MGFRFDGNYLCVNYCIPVCAFVIEMQCDNHDDEWFWSESLTVACYCCSLGVLGKRYILDELVDALFCALRQ